MRLVFKKYCQELVYDKIPVFFSALSHTREQGTKQASSYLDFVKEMYYSHERKILHGVFFIGLFNERVLFCHLLIAVAQLQLFFV